MFTTVRLSGAIALAFMGAGCSLPDMGRGPSLVDRVLRTPEERQFPVLSQMPNDAPERENFTVVMKSHDDLMAQRETLYAGIEEDVRRARAERLIAVPVTGSEEPLAILEAAARVRAAAEADRAAAAAQSRQPVPDLGGKPPKDQR